MSLLFGSESIYIIKWYFALLILGVTFFPFTSRFFSCFEDKGYLFSKTIGVAFSGMFVFWSANFGIISFTPVSCLLASIALVLIINLCLFFKNGRSLKETFSVGVNLKLLLSEEVLFFVLLVALLYMKSFNPDAYGTEKFMDYAFMNSMTKLADFPVMDVWFANEPLNYYYLGQYFAAFLNQLSFNSVMYSYNIMFYTICALGFCLTFSIVYTLLKVRFKDGLASIHCVLGGLLGGATVCFAGSAHFIVYGIVLKLWNKLIHNDSYSYWFPESTRYVGYMPERADKTITETPSYSFVIGDLHAHVINIIFVLTIIGILVAFAISMSGEDRKTEINPPRKLIDFVLKSITPTVLICGFFTGIFQGNNYWDFPIYMMVTFLTILFVNYRVLGFSIVSTLYSIIQADYVFVIANIVIYPFSRNFTEMVGGMKLAENHTLFSQLLVLWALPVVGGVVWAVFFIKDFIGEKKTIAGLIKEEKITNLMVLLFLCCAVGLILIPEIIYVKDIYDIEYARANTTFKLTYQAFIMLGIVTGYGVIDLLHNKKSIVRKVFGSVYLCGTLLCIMFFFSSCHSWFGNIFDSSRNHTLNAMRFFETTPQLTDDIPFINYINETISDGKTVVLEASGDAYSDVGRISVATGQPTVLGWFAHEWLWRFNYDIVDERNLDIKAIYCDHDLENTKRLVEKYNIDYIYVGNTEYLTYNKDGLYVDIDKLTQLGEVVMAKDSNYSSDYYSYLIKVR